MKIKYDIIEDDLLDYNMFYTSISPTIQRSLLWQRYVVPIIYLAIPFLLNYFNEDPLIVLLPLFTFTAVLWFFLYPKYFKWIIKKRVLKMIQEGDNKGTVGIHELTLMPDEIVQTGEFGEARVKWDVVQKVYTTDKHIFIFIGSMKAYIIPKRAFDNENSYNEFLSAVNKYRPKL